MDLPAEAIREILARLPVRTLLRCRSVCRSWRSLIRDPYFIAEHLKRSSSDPTRFLIATYYSGADTKYFISLLCCETLEVLHRIDIPGVITSSYPTVVSSVNGVVCLQSGYRISLLNPATGEFRHLQDPISALEDSWEWHFGVNVGFGYSRRIADHKLVRVQPLKVGLERRYEAHVFALGEGVWRDVEAPALSCGVICRCEGTVVDGVVHWLVRGDGLEVILSFDLGNDKFSQQSLPDFGEEDGVSKMLSVFNESLRLIVYPSPYNAGSLTVWVRNSQCVWTRLMRIDRDFRSFDPVGWGSRGEIFMDYDYHNYLVAYEPTTRVLRDVRIDAEKRPSYCDFHLCRESLVPLR